MDVYMFYKEEEGYIRRFFSLDRPNDRKKLEDGCVLVTSDLKHYVSKDLEDLPVNAVYEIATFFLGNHDASEVLSCLPACFRDKAYRSWLSGMGHWIHPLYDKDSGNIVGSIGNRDRKRASTKTIKPLPMERDGMNRDDNALIASEFYDIDPAKECD
jgi:hypothetical protein